jgi:hypothetical protein
MHLNRKVAISAALSIALGLSSCDKKETSVAPPQPDTEVITTMQLRAVNTADPTDTLTAQWVQLDPTGATAPNLSNDTMRFRAGSEYSVEVKVLDTLTDLTPEIRSKGNFHLVCFTTSAGVNLTTLATDQDTNTPKLPIGLSQKFTTGAACAGKINGTLRHQPGIKNGSCTVGETDLSADFYVIVR